MNNSILTIIENVIKNNGEIVAIKSGPHSLTYRQLGEQSDRLAQWLCSNVEDNEPVMVYGHKNPQMIVCFMACVKSGRAYCPVDISMPADRVKDIAEAIGNKTILATENFALNGFRVIGKNDISRICDQAAGSGTAFPVSGNDTFYIIFTSGSTGKPKGVEISESNLSKFAEWSVNLAGARLTDEKINHPIFMNQAPFSFDLSVMDLYTSLAMGGTLVCVDKAQQQNTAEMFEYMRNSSITCWVSTPSFAEMCMADHSFDSSLLPEMELFLFCGEKLGKETAEKLSERFPQAKIVNTYGPTESTVAVTFADVTPEMIKKEGPLPIGQPKPGTQLVIEGEEIVIIGDTVAKGYYKNPEKTEQVFFQTPDKDGKMQKAYRTGDKGFYDGKNFYCTGRMDGQIKLHGYRIELGDIENNLMNISLIEQAAVLPKYDGDKIKSLVAYVKAPSMEGSFGDGKKIKSLLKEKIPAYMVPKNIKFLDKMPMTANGKLDRKKLEAGLI